MFRGLILIHCQVSLYFMLSVLFVSYAAAIELVVATGINNDPPYVYVDQKKQSEFPGVTIDVLRLIEARSDIKFVINKHPWKRVVKEIMENKIDGGFHFSFKEERRSFVAYPIPDGEVLPDPKYSISNRSYIIYNLKGQAIHWDGGQIVMGSKCKNIIGVIRGSSIIDGIKKNGFKWQEADTDKQLLKLLLGKRVDAIVGLENMIDAKIKTLNAKEREQIEKSLPAIVNKPYYIAFSKKFYRENQEKAWQVWETIDNIKHNGELKKLFEKYSNK